MQRLKNNAGPQENLCGAPARLGADLRTTEVFLWPSIVFQPLHLARSMIGGRVWEKPKAPAGYSAASFTGKPQPSQVINIDRLSRSPKDAVATVSTET